MLNLLKRVRRWSARNPKTLRRVLRLLLIAHFPLIQESTFAQRYKLSYDAETPAGQHLELLELQSNGEKKVVLMEQFLKRHPQDPAVGWVAEQLMPAQFSAGRYDDVLATCEALFRVSPNDLEAAQICVKAAEQKKDKLQIQLWSDFARRLAEKIVMAPQPKDPIDREKWNSLAQVASHYTARGEYEQYRKAQQISDPAARAQFLEELLSKSPAGEYTNQAMALLVLTYRALGNSRQAAAIGEKILAVDPNAEDALLAVAEWHLQRRSESTVFYAGRIIELMKTKAKPADARDEDWEKRKAVLTGTAYWMMGNIHLQENRWQQADQALRAALSRMPGNEAPILFYLGWANYKMENYSDAMRFYRQCSATRSQFQSQALKNITVIESESKVQD